MDAEGRATHRAVAEGMSGGYLLPLAPFFQRRAQKPLSLRERGWGEGEGSKDIVNNNVPKPRPVVGGALAATQSPKVAAKAPPTASHSIPRRYNASKTGKIPPLKYRKVCNNRSKRQGNAADHNTRIHSRYRHASNHQYSR